MRLLTLNMIHRSHLSYPWKSLTDINVLTALAFWPAASPKLNFALLNKKRPGEILQWIMWCIIAYLQYLPPQVCISCLEGFDNLTGADLLYKPWFNFNGCPIVYDNQHFLWTIKMYEDDCPSDNDLFLFLGQNMLSQSDS